MNPAHKRAIDPHRALFEPWESHDMKRFLLTLSCLLACPANLLAEPTGALNVVFILADDLGWGELGCYGQKKIPTPHLDTLAAQGMRFTQHYSGAPVCAPSRCVLMTGKHLGHAEVRGNLQAKRHFPQFDEGQHPLTEGAMTVVQLFQKAGYSTGAMGKWGLGPVGSTGDPSRKGFDLFFGYNCQVSRTVTTRPTSGATPRKSSSTQSPFRAMPNSRKAR